MESKLDNQDILHKITKFPWLQIIKAIVVICAFLAFSLSMREKEFSRFSEIKPIFEIISLKEPNKFKIINHGGLVFFLGCEKSALMKRTPRQYDALEKGENSPLNEFEFHLSRHPKSDDMLFLYWRDVDLNTYRMKIGTNRNNIFIDGVPLAKRSDLFYSMSNDKLDWLISTIFPKNWFSDFAVKKDKELQIVEDNN